MLALTEIHRPSRRLIHTENYWVYNVQLNWNIVQTEIQKNKKKYQGT